MYYFNILIIVVLFHMVTVESEYIKTRNKKNHLFRNTRRLSGKKGATYGPTKFTINLNKKDKGKETNLTEDVANLNLFSEMIKDASEALKAAKSSERANSKAPDHHAADPDYRHPFQLNHPYKEKPHENRIPNVKYQHPLQLLHSDDEKTHHEKLTIEEHHDPDERNQHPMQVNHHEEEHMGDVFPEYDDFHEDGHHKDNHGHNERPHLFHSQNTFHPFEVGIDHPLETVENEIEVLNEEMEEPDDHGGCTHCDHHNEFDSTLEHALPILERISEEVEKHKEDTICARNDFPCDLNGAWMSNIGGVKLFMAKHADGRVTVSYTDQPFHKDGEFSNCVWHFSGLVPNHRETPFALAAVCPQQSRVATFVGQCKVCEDSETIFGSWTFARIARDCSEAISAIDMREDVWRKDHMAQYIAHKLNHDSHSHAPHHHEHHDEEDDDHHDDEDDHNRKDPHDDDDHNHQDTHGDEEHNDDHIHDNHSHGDQDHNDFHIHDSHDHDNHDHNKPEHDDHDHSKHCDHNHGKHGDHKSREEKDEEEDDNEENESDVFYDNEVDVDKETDKKI